MILAGPFPLEEVAALVGALEDILLISYICIVVLLGSGLYYSSKLNTLYRQNSFTLVFPKYNYTSTYLAIT